VGVVGRHVYLPSLKYPQSWLLVVGLVGVVGVVGVVGGEQFQPTHGGFEGVGVIGVVGVWATGGGTWTGGDGGV